MTDDNTNWRTPNFRQNVVQKINEAILSTGASSSRNGIKMEAHAFQKAKTKDEYLAFVARLTLHVREMNSKNKNPQNIGDVNNTGGPKMTDDNTNWRTPNFRQNVVQKINEAILSTGASSSRNGIKMEAHAFQKAKTKDEYLAFVARLTLYVREMNSKNKNPQNIGDVNNTGGPKMTDDNTNWRTPNFRQNVVQKINEAILSTGASSSRNGIKMEAHAFQKAKTKDEYLAFVARLTLHVREMNSKNKNPQNIGDVNNTGGPKMTDDNTNWRTPNFRQNVVQKINEAILSTGASSSRNGIKMEAHAFQKAKTKDEYLAFVARLTLYVREMNSKNKNPQNIGDVNNTGGPKMTDDNTNWRTPNFRQNVVQKINEAILSTGASSSRNGIKMEAHAFQKAKTKDEYLAFVARLTLHVREMNSKNKNPQNIGDVNNTGGPGMPDPINALQNMASHGTRNPQMMGMPGAGPAGGGNMGVEGVPASNLLQTLTQQRPGQQNPQQQQMNQQNMGRGGPMINQVGGPLQCNNMQPNNNMSGGRADHDAISIDGCSDVTSGAESALLQSDVEGSVSETVHRSKGKRLGKRRRQRLGSKLGSISEEPCISASGTPKRTRDATGHTPEMRQKSRNDPTHKLLLYQQ